MSTQIYEQENSRESFSAVVKIVREVQGETQVFFEGHQGFYSLGSESFQPKLVKSQSKKKPIHVEADPEARRILSVDFEE